MLINAEGLMQILTSADSLRILHDQSVDSLMCVSILDTFLQMRMTRYTSLGTTNNKLSEILQKIDKTTKLIVLFNLGQDLELDKLVSSDQNVLLIAVQLPVALSNILANNIIIFDDNSIAMQFQSIFRPKDLGKTIDAFNKQEEQERSQIKSQSNVISQQLLTNERESPLYASKSNIFSEVVSELNSERTTPFRDTPIQQSALRHAVYSQVFDDQTDEVDDLDDIYDEDEEEDEFDESMRDFIDNSSIDQERIDRVDRLRNSQVHQSRLRSVINNENTETSTASVLSNHQSQLQSESEHLLSMSKRVSEEELRLLDDIQPEATGTELHKLFLNFVPELDEQKMQTFEQDLNRLEPERKAKMVQSYYQQKSNASPAASRLAESIIRYNLDKDDHMKHFFDRILFFAFTAVIYRFQLNQTTEQYFEHFHKNIKDYLTPGKLNYMEKDINLPGFRILTIEQAISASPLQFCLHSLELQKGQEYRMQQVLSKLGIQKKLTGTQCYTKLDKDIRKLIRAAFAGLDKRVHFPVLAPNLVYKSDTFEFSAADFQLLLDIRPDLSFCDFKQIQQHLRSGAIQTELQIYLNRIVSIYEHQNIFYRRNFLLFTSIIENVSKTRFAAFSEMATVLSQFNIAVRRYQTPEERDFFKNSRILLPQFAKLKLQKIKRDYCDILNHFTTIIVDAETAFVKWNGIGYVGGYMAQKWIKDFPEQITIEQIMTGETAKGVEASTKVIMNK
ncbi:Conserved_hypothetical protein [Hexamita inflata]|uniref:Uncharacterized protein n=1 Tax=Hexamita inflata TaxID=28002 RepID=A0AA86UBN1_9EUKA|nr:Conserved hypothetical protein [Hexamita inflata]